MNTFGIADSMFFFFYIKIVFDLRSVCIDHKSCGII